MDQATIREIRAMTAYRVVVVGMRVFLGGFAAMGILVGLVALGALPVGVLDLAPLFMLILIPAVIVTAGMLARIGRIALDFRGGDGYQIGDQGTYFKLLLRDIFTGYRP